MSSDKKLRSSGGARVGMKQTWWCGQPESLQEVDERNTSHLCFYTQKNIC